MTIDARGQNYSEIFKQIKDAAPDFYSIHEELLVFVGANDLNKSRLIRGFVEILLGCETDLVEASGFYIIRAVRDTTAAVN